MLYNPDGQPIHCGNCLWGHPKQPSIRLYLSASDIDNLTSSNHVTCRRDPRRGSDSEFAVMRKTDHCSRHTLLARNRFDGFSRPTLLVPVDFPSEDILRADCPRCAAKPGQDCILPDGITPRGGTHEIRLGPSREKAWRDFLPECPHCGAGAGEKCVTSDGRSIYSIHYGRESPAWSAAAKMMSEQ